MKPLPAAVVAALVASGCASPRESPPVTAEQPRAKQSARCTPLPPSGGSVITVTPAQSDELARIVGSAPAHSVILLADGVYSLRHGLHFEQPDVTMRSQSAQEGISSDPQRVVIDGLNGFAGAAGAADIRVPELVDIVASGVTIADVTLRNARDHLIHVQTAGRDTRNTKIYNARIIDPGQQAVKINTTPGSGVYADDGEIRCSELELTETGRRFVAWQTSDGCYTGGIDAHQARGWRFVDNIIRGFWCERGLSEHAIHVWTGSRDTVIEGNRISNSARGIGLGLGQYSGTVWRNYSDGVCGGTHNLGHYGGRVGNNTVLANAPRLGSSDAGFDTGISLESACDAVIANNTVFSTVGFRSSAIEWRFPATTGVMVINNLTNGRVTSRNSASGETRTNVTDAAADWFESVSGDGDLHLARSVTPVVGRGTPIPDLPADLDGAGRGSPPDVGAYQFQAGVLRR